MSSAIPVILSGGSGSRLWPLSREMYPKQLLALTGPKTMLQDTLSRVASIHGTGAPIIVCNEAHRFMIAEQMRALPISPAAIILEPVGRNTAPAAALAALQALKIDPLATLIVAPADHVIRDVKAFHRAAEVALAEAAAGKLVTFGIVAYAPETGYGYIRRRAMPGEGIRQAYPVAEFVEKPPLELARRFVESGSYYWNSGIFVFQAARYIEELRHFAPDILSVATAAFSAASTDLDFVRIDKAIFATSRSDSIDYAVMEKTRDAMVVPLDAGWSDVGSWSSLCDALPSDEQGNVLQGDVLVHDVQDCYVHSTSRLVAAVGMVDHVIVETKDAVLVAPKGRVQDVRELVNLLKKAARSESSLHREVFRPWGSYDSLDHGERFQVKHLSVKPGGVLSLQLHHHRAEHWVVVSGTARITCDDRIFTLSENESTYIPLGAKHRIENPGDQPLHIIEVQSGSYLGEDDIVRFEDSYGRQGDHDVKPITCFKAYDLRGRIPDDLNDDVAYRVGRGYAKFLSPRRVVVGRDVRLSSAALTDALCRGLSDSGVDIDDIGICGTEGVYFATFDGGYDGGIMVTASHNPSDYNGMKFVRQQSRPISGDNGLKDIQAHANSADFPAAATRGERRSVDTNAAYIGHLLSYVDLAKLKPLKIVVNAGNGGAGLVIDQLQEHLPFEFIKVHHEPDGHFPNGIPNPMLEDNRAPTIEAILRSGADFGIAWDGDFDRCFLFDERGQFIEGYYIVGLLASVLLRDEPGGRVVHDPRLTWNTVEVVEASGGSAVLSKSGHAFIKQRMREVDGLYGGEMSAHHYFRRFAYCDSGMIPWLIVAQRLCESGKRLSQLVGERMSMFPVSGELNYRVPDAKSASAAVEERYAHAALHVDRTDGLSCEFPAWRFNLRSSNTEPLLRLNVEARGSVALMRAKTEELFELLRSHGAIAADT